MKTGVALQLMGDLLWNGLLIAGPLLLSTLLVGVLISIIQAVTQVQELSLTYIPKILVAVAVLIALGPWMLRRLIGYATTVISNIPSYF